MVCVCGVYSCIERLPFARNEGGQYHSGHRRQVRRSDSRHYAVPSESEYPYHRQARKRVDAMYGSSSTHYYDPVSIDDHDDYPRYSGLYEDEIDGHEQASPVDDSENWYDDHVETVSQTGAGRDSRGLDVRVTMVPGTAARRSSRDRQIHDSTAAAAAGQGMNHSSHLAADWDENWDSRSGESLSSGAWAQEMMGDYALSHSYAAGSFADEEQPEILVHDEDEDSKPIVRSVLSSDADESIPSIGQAVPDENENERDNRSCENESDLPVETATATATAATATTDGGGDSGKAANQLQVNSETRGMEEASSPYYHYIDSDHEDCTDDSSSPSSDDVAWRPGCKAVEPSVRVRKGKRRTVFGRKRESVPAFVKKKLYIAWNPVLLVQCLNNSWIVLQRMIAKIPFLFAMRGWFGVCWFAMNFFQCPL